VGDQAEQVQGIDVPGVDPENLAVEPLGGWEVAGLMMTQGQVERLG
jgi:hypothetical protein